MPAVAPPTQAAPPADIPSAQPRAKDSSAGAATTPDVAAAQPAVRAAQEPYPDVQPGAIEAAAAPAVVGRSAAEPAVEPGSVDAPDPGEADAMIDRLRAALRALEDGQPADLLDDAADDGGEHRSRTIDLTLDPLAEAQGTTEPDDLTPIAKQAAAAVRALNPGGRYDFPKPAERRIITVANQKGGVGKTTSTVNLAAALALHGAEVLVLDLDPQGNCSTALGVPHSSGTPSIYEVLIEQVPIAEVVVPADGVPGLRCVPATIDLAGAEIELVSVVARENRLRRSIEAYLDEQGADVDYVLVDCPPSLGLLTVNAMVATNELLIPIQCEYYALEGLGQLLRNVELVQRHLNPRLHVSTILLTMYDGRTRLADQVADEVRSHFGDKVITTAVPRSVRISEAPGYGQTVVTYDPGSRGALAYVEAARELAERGAPAPAGAASR